ncbi:hypothetical protein G9X64_27585 [Rhizobium sophorae]|uniref:Transmembrane protein n=1 Tax=Rhizobium sophorae TaxID=1535242 RepID=A0A7Y3SAR6_9HYPH|nr:hypothetical protein [Rhizobium sophorae]MBX4861046.1 hypothetical protein [Rhizobium bangladeshense]NNU40176.1 hypothetical protein [Rhizobium sophorae]
MNDSFLREPQVELFFQAYFIGMALGHLPFFFDDIGFIAFIPKFIVSLPIVFILFIFYRVKYCEINSRPVLWSFIIFIAILLLITAAFLLLSGGSIQRLTLLAFFLFISLPSVFVACMYFTVIIRLRLRGKAVR